MLGLELVYPKRHVHRPYDPAESGGPDSELVQENSTVSVLISKVHRWGPPSLSQFQSAYRKSHSTETALLKIHNDRYPV